MLINVQNLKDLQVMVNTQFAEGKLAAAAQGAAIATFLKSGSSKTTYPDFSQWPGFRKWVGDRQFKDMSKATYTIENETFESSVEISREDIEDDNLGFLAHIAKATGQATVTHSDEILFPLLQAGFTNKCHDGKNFFAEDHVGADGAAQSNLLAGTAAHSWFLLDTTKVIKPLIFQTRRDYNLTSKINLNDDNVFNQNAFQWGVDARVAAGYGPYMTAIGAKVGLDATAYAEARRMFGEMTSPEGRPYRTSGNLLVVGPALEGAARELLKAERTSGGKSNIWANSCEIMVVPGL